MATTLVGVSGPIWGTSDQTNFYVESFDRRDGAAKEELTNGQGDITSIAYHGQKSDLTIRGKVLNPGALPTRSSIGSTITITDNQLGGVYLIDDITKAKKKGDWMEVELALSEYPSVTETATPTTTTTT